MFHAGTALNGEEVVTDGGRVLTVTALGDNVSTAQRRAYEIVGQIRFEGMQIRRDIGHRAHDDRRAGSDLDGSKRCNHGTAVYDRTRQTSATSSGSSTSTSPIPISASRRSSTWSGWASRATPT